MTTSRGAFPAVFFALALAGTALACSKGSDDGPANNASGGSSGGSGGRSGSGGGSASGGSGAGGSPGGSGGASGGSSASGGGAGGGGGVNTGGDSGSGTGGAPADAAQPTGSGGAGFDAATSPADAPTSDGPFALTSSVFKEGQDIAKLYMCKHENLTPPLAWTPGPAGTLSYAVTMLHATALHWVLWDIPAGTTSLQMDVAKMPMPPVPAGSKQAKPNIDGATWYGYTGPCPATASHYEYIVHALKVATLPGVTPESSTAVVNAAILKNELKSAQLSGTASAK